jgi:uncharacterized protein
MDLARNWRRSGARLRLEGARCEACGTVQFPARESCERCRSAPDAAAARNGAPGVARDGASGVVRDGAPGVMKPYRFSGRGELVSFSVVHEPPAGFEAYVPYVAAWVKLAEGPTVAAQLADVDPADVRIGMPVEAVTRRLFTDGPEGLVVFGYKFRPRVTRGTHG